MQTKGKRGSQYSIPIIKLDFGEVMRAHPKEDLIQSGKRGFIAGPEETEGSFLQRIEKTLALCSDPPKECDHFLTDTDWEEPLQKIEELFGINPDWIVSYYSDAKLAFFQAAATWIVERQGETLPLIQLKKRFSEKRSALRSDILAHEAIHAVRARFKEPFFEEFFAYTTSRNLFRRFFGPLFHRTFEPWLFLFLFLLPLGGEVARLYFPEKETLWTLFFWAPWALSALLLLRLFVGHGLLALAAYKLGRHKVAVGRERAFLLHLTDREIFRLALLPFKNFLHKNPSLRWRQILAIFK